MAEDRKSWPQAGMDAKVSALSDLEHRVWEQYKLSANDLGVMPASAAVIQGANKSLAARPAKLIQKCLEGIIGVGLLMTFMAEDSLFVWSRKWQDWQQIKWPRRSPLPMPTDLQKASPKTQELFRTYCEKHQVELPESLRITSQDLDRISSSRAGAPSGQARNPHPNPHPDAVGGSRSAEESARETTTALALDESFAQFWAVYPVKASRTMAEMAWATLNPDAELVARIMAALAWQVPAWKREPARFTPHAENYLKKSRWRDERPADDADDSDAAFDRVVAGEGRLR